MKNIPSEWGQGDNIPLWGAGVKPLQKMPLLYRLQFRKRAL